MSIMETAIRELVAEGKYPSAALILKRMGNKPRSDGRYAFGAKDIIRRNMIFAKMGIVPVRAGERPNAAIKRTSENSC